MRSVLACFGSVSAVALVLTMGSPVVAGSTVYEDGDRKIEIGGRVQAVYASFSADCPNGVDCLLEDSDLLPDSDYDRLFFRRLRPYISGTITKNWVATIEFDFGEAEDTNEVQIKDAYFARSGYPSKGKLTIGNAKSVFGREFLNSSSSLQLVERGFVGDHNYGVPDRALGVRWDAQAGSGRIGYAANVGGQNHDPAINRLDFDTPVNNGADWNEGILAAARIDFHPLGYLKMSQGDFKRDEPRFTIGIGAFTWMNDDDNNTYTDAAGMTTSSTKVDLDKANGYELSGAFRGFGLSLDAEIQRVGGDTVDGTFTGGLYVDGSTDLDKLAVVAGYMFEGVPLEIAAGWNSQDADNYFDEWQQTTVGVNWYFNEHNMKVQLNYRLVTNYLGLPDQDHNVVVASTQFVF